MSTSNSNDPRDLPADSGATATPVELEGPQSSIDNDPRRMSLWRDVRSGVAGPFTRLALSSAAAAGLSGSVLFLMGLAGVFDPGLGRVLATPEAVAAGLTLAMLLWCASLTMIWGADRRLRRVLFTVVEILAVCLGAVTLVAALRLAGPDAPTWSLLLAGVGLGSAALAVLVVARAQHQQKQIRPIADASGRVPVACPRCGYSMTGLSECRCPECGTQYTLDGLIRLQDYDSVAKLASMNPRGGRPQAPRPSGNRLSWLMADLSPTSESPPTPDAT